MNVATIIALVVAAITIAFDASDRVVLVVYITATLIAAMLLGVFNMPEEHKNSIRKESSDEAHESMRDAA